MVNKINVAYTPQFKKQGTTISTRVSWDTLALAKDGVTMTGTSTGKTTLSTANTTATDYILTFPAETGTLITTAWPSALITVANEATDTSCYPVFVTDATGNLWPKSNAGLTFNSNTSILTATWFAWPLNGTVGATTPTTVVGTTITANTWFLPDVDDWSYLGQAGTAFSDLFLAEWGVINRDSWDVTLTQTGNELALAGWDLALWTNSITSGTKVTLWAAAWTTGSIDLKWLTSWVVTLSVADAAGTWTMKLPTTDWDANQVLITDGSGNTSWATNASLLWTAVAADAGLTVNTGTLANKAGLLTMTLPSTASVGDTIKLAGMNAGWSWKIAQNASQYINFWNQVTTTWVWWYLASTNAYDTLELICHTANNGRVVVSSIWNITVV